MLKKVCRVNKWKPRQHFDKRYVAVLFRGITHLNSLVFAKVEEAHAKNKEVDKRLFEVRAAVKEKETFLATAEKERRELTIASRKILIFVIVRMFYSPVEHAERMTALRERLATVTQKRDEEAERLNHMMVCLEWFAWLRVGIRHPVFIFVG